MSTETTKQTSYGVARDKQLIKGGFADIAVARTELAFAEQRMTELGLEPDLRVVEYDVETSIKTGPVRAYKEPTENTEAESDGASADAAGETSA